VTVAERRSGAADPQRLEELWAGDFGRAYVARNANAGASRGPFWADLLDRHPAQRIVEVGCNTGANLEWIARMVDPRGVFGIDVSQDAVVALRDRIPTINAVCGLARDLPFRDAFFDLSFTTGVLIHQPDESLIDVMAEIVRVSRRYILAGEYFAEAQVELPYRGESGALFKRDYGRIYADTFPALRLVDNGFLGRDKGWDDVTWWLFEKG
jgi:pseudaminic acid biosynthesis-associated methylase